ASTRASSRSPTSSTRLDRWGLPRRSRLPRTARSSRSSTCAKTAGSKSTPCRCIRCASSMVLSRAPRWKLFCDLCFASRGGAERSALAARRLRSLEWTVHPNCHERTWQLERKCDFSSKDMAAQGVKPASPEPGAVRAALPAAGFEQVFRGEPGGREAAHRVAEALGDARQHLGVAVVRRRLDDRLRTRRGI